MECDAKEDLSERTKQFALAVIQLGGHLPHSNSAQILGRQLLRSGTSIGANYREARHARSKAEFVSKIHIALQEARETAYWLELIFDANICQEAGVQALVQEASELCAIFIASARTASTTSKKCNS